MAHYLAGTAVGPGAAYDFLNQVVTHLESNGWTQVWGVAGDHAMMQGASLDAVAGNAPFVFINVTSTTGVQFIPYWDADSSAQVGIQAPAATTTVTVQDASFPFWIRANGVAFAIALKAGTQYNKGYFGYLRRGLTPQTSGMTKATGAIAVGATSIPTASDMTSKLLVGQRVMVVNYAHDNTSPNKTNAEAVTITGITGGASPSLQVSATVKAYDAGALIGQHVHVPAFIPSYGSGSSFATSNGYACLDGLGNITPIAGYSNYNIIASNPGSVDPADDTGEYASGVWSFGLSTLGKTGDLGTLYHLISFATSGTPAAEDVLSDGVNTYLIIGNYTSSPGIALGPRED